MHQFFFTTLQKKKKIDAPPNLKHLLADGQLLINVDVYVTSASLS